MIEVCVQRSPLSVCLRRNISSSKHTSLSSGPASCHPRRGSACCTTNSKQAFRKGRDGGTRLEQGCTRRRQLDRGRLSHHNISIRGKEQCERQKNVELEVREAGPKERLPSAISTASEAARSSRTRRPFWRHAAFNSWIGWKVETGANTKSQNPCSALQMCYLNRFSKCIFYVTFFL